MHEIRMTRVWVVAGLLALAATQVEAETSAQMEANKKVVVNFIHDVFNAEDVTKINQYIDEGYIQHNPNFPPGRVGYTAILSKRFAKPKPPGQIKLTQFDMVLAVDDLVETMLKTQRSDPGAPGKTYDSYWFDLFRVKNGKIIEHWDSALKTSPGMTPRD